MKSKKKREKKEEEAKLDPDNIYVGERWECPHCETPGALFAGGKFQYCPICSSSLESDPS